MGKISLICHTVLALATVFSVGAGAQSLSCSELFNRSQVGSQIEKIDYRNAAQQMRDMSMSKGLLKYYSPKTEHQLVLAWQVPLVMNSLLAKLDVAKKDLKKMERYNIGNEPLRRPKQKLSEALDQSFERLNADASDAIANKKVTYEWYMDFFMKSIVLSDVTARISDRENKESFEILTKKLDDLLGKTNNVYISDSRAMTLYTSLGKKYANFSRSTYFAKFAKNDPIIPILFVPRNQDVIRGQIDGYHFVSFVEGKTMTIEGPKFPLEFAGLQMEQNLRDIRIAEEVEFSKDNHSIFNASLAYKIQENPEYQALYAFILRDAGLKGEIAKRTRQGFIVFHIPFESHQVSIFLKKYFKLHDNDVSKVATPETVENFLRVVYDLEKRILARDSER